MVAPPSPWQIALARIEGALPFLSPELAEVLAMRSLRRLWAVHVRDFPFDVMGLEHNPGIEAAELMRSWYADERRDFLSWVARKGAPPLAGAARAAMAAKGVTERFTAVNRQNSLQAAANAHCRQPAEFTATAFVQRPSNSY